MKKLLLSALLGLAIGISAQTPKPPFTQAVVKVSVTNDKNQIQAGQPVTFISTKDNKKYYGTTDEAGKFSIKLPIAQKYKVVYKVFNEDYGDLSLDVPDSKSPFALTYQITVTPPQTLTLNDVLFDNGKSSLRPESNKELDQVAEYLKIKKTLVIEIAGHTDNVGKPEANRKLSEDRANTVRQYVVKKGIAPERILAKGYGDTQPVADNGTAAGKQKNRRTEVRIISE